jgi:hypothetical protein
VQQDFAKLDAACRGVALDVNAPRRGQIRGADLLLRRGPGEILPHRSEYQAHRRLFRHDIIGQVRRSGKCGQPPDGPWIYVDESDSLEPVIELIRQSSDAALAK